MKKFAIRYRDSSGEITDGIVSDIAPEGREAVIAYCHSRYARRIFKLTNVIFAADPESGEVIENIWQAFGLATSPDGRERIESLLASSLPAVKALKFFTLVQRGFAKRERDHLLQFMKQNFEIDGYADEEIEEWLQQLWCGNVCAYRDGDTNEYELLLQAIPIS